MNKENELISFLNEFSSDFNKACLIEEKQFNPNLLSFLNQYSQPLIELEIKKQEEAYYYNIFEILKIQSLEALVHTPFIANLLNTNGSHACGDMFLNSFIKYAKLFNDDKQEVPIELLEIKDEKNLAENGSADIYIHFERDKRKYALIIENKVYAGDQERQLTRYYDYLKKDKSMKKLDDIFLIYLTINKKTPSKTSLTDENGNVVTLNSIRTTLLGYKADIIPWLSECIKSHMPDKIKYILQQYIESLKKL